MSYIVDLTGKRFSKLTVLNYDHSEPRYGAFWRCQCDCGNITVVRSNDLQTGNTKSCGCYQVSSRFNRQSKDLTGLRFGRLVAIRIAYKTDKNLLVWECKCDCGNITYVSVDALRGQHPIRSCGCLHRSLGEIEIEKILIDNKLSFVKQYPIPGHRFDFAIKNNSDKIIRLIEFDGEQHFTNIANWDSVELQQ